MAHSTVACRSTEGLLTLLQLKGVGTKTAARLAQTCTTLQQVRDHAEEGTLAGNVPAAAHRSLRDDRAWASARSAALTLLENAAARGVRLLSVYDSDYPLLLHRIKDRPLILYVRGTLRPGCRNVACVGTRKPTAFGIEAARSIVPFLVEHDWSIVSGLALGIDTESHQQCLAHGGHTAAIVGNGLDSVYPLQNQRLADAIVANGGAVLSEQPFAAQATPAHLVARDRLQSGMSVGTVVLQTPGADGTMHTVRFTLTQGRLLFAAVPKGPQAQEPESQGNVVLTQRSGIELAEQIQARGEYQDLLENCFASRPVAEGIRGRKGHPRLLQMLEQAASALAQA